jgi:hypothetical protein
MRLVGEKGSEANVPGMRLFALAGLCVLSAAMLSTYLDFPPAHPTPIAAANDQVLPCG